VDARIPFDEFVVSERGLDEPPGAIDDAARSHLDQAHRAGGRTAGVRGLEVDCGEIQWHGAMLACPTDATVEDRRVPRIRNPSIRPTTHATASVAVHRLEPCARETT
jgi:hypothetical protein